MHRTLAIAKHFHYELYVQYIRVGLGVHVHVHIEVFQGVNPKLVPILDLGPTNIASAVRNDVTIPMCTAVVTTCTYN